jgi:hypothetical protein
MNRRPRCGDDLLADLLIVTWVLTSGRMLPLGVQPQELTGQALIDFWADDISPPGCHDAARPQQPPWRYSS